MIKIHYQCSNCGKRFQTSPIPGVPDGMYLTGCRAVGDAFYCEDCVKTWAERNGAEFDKQYKAPQGMFAKWWNRTVVEQCKGANIKSYKVLSNGDYVEDGRIIADGIQKETSDNRSDTVYRFG